MDLCIACNEYYQNENKIPFCSTCQPIDSIDKPKELIFEDIFIKYTEKHGIKEYMIIDNNNKCEIIKQMIIKMEFNYQEIIDMVIGLKDIPRLFFMAQYTDEILSFIQSKVNDDVMWKYIHIFANCTIDKWNIKNNHGVMICYHTYTDASKIEPTTENGYYSIWNNHYENVLGYVGMCSYNRICKNCDCSIGNPISICNSCNSFYHNLCIGKSSEKMQIIVCSDCSK